MSKAQSWVMMGVSSIALVIGVLLATGALTLAQTNTPTTAPSATTGPGDAPEPTGMPGIDAPETPDATQATDSQNNHQNECGDQGADASSNPPSCSDPGDSATDNSG